MTQPAPLTPADCDLQDFPFMPLHVARLRDSDLAAEGSPEACWYAVLLWAASWHQLPAGSLPNNDDVLARLIGLGRDVRTFRKHKASAMRGFILCSDGRLYHPVVAEQAVGAWESKRQQRWRTECARIKKRNQRDGTNLPTPTYEEFIAGSSLGQTDPRPDNVPRDNGESPQGQTIQETGTGTGILEDTPQPPSGGEPRSEAFERAWAAYPIAGRGNHGPAEAWAIWPEAVDMAGSEPVLVRAVEARAAYLAQNPTERPKTFHRWLRDGGFVSYIDREAAPAWDGPPTVFAAVAAEGRGEGFAKSWLARCKMAGGAGSGDRHHVQNRIRQAPISRRRGA